MMIDMTSDKDNDDAVADACATRLAEIITLCTVRDNRCQPELLTTMLRERWKRVSALAHAIHGKDP